MVESGSLDAHYGAIPTAGRVQKAWQRHVAAYCVHAKKVNTEPNAGRNLRRSDLESRFNVKSTSCSGFTRCGVGLRTCNAPSAAF